MTVVVDIDELNNTGYLQERKFHVLERSNGVVGMKDDGASHHQDHIQYTN